MVDIQIGFLPITS